MDLHELKEQSVKEALGIEKSFGRILSFVDFANVNYWFEEDRYDAEGSVMLENEKLSISIENLKTFSDTFSTDTRFYYGHDSANPASLGFLSATKHVFGKNRVFTKPIQKVKHYLTEQEAGINTRTLQHDAKGDFIRIPKCNFDVEICVDAIRLVENYDTFCLFSSDADFVHLTRILKKGIKINVDSKKVIIPSKKIILVKGGYIHHSLHDVADLIISAQDIKKYIAIKKQKPGG